MTADAVFQISNNSKPDPEYNATALPTPPLPAGVPPSHPPPLPDLSPIYTDSDAPYVSESTKPQDSDYGAEDSELDDDIRTMFINVR